MSITEYLTSHVFVTSPRRRVSCLLLLLFVTLQITGVFTGCPELRLPRGQVRYRQQRTIAKFICDGRYRIIGPKYITCNHDQWDNELPICVRKGCSPPALVPNGLYVWGPFQAVLIFRCKAGFELNGPRSIYCDGVSWNTTYPTCQPKQVEPPALFCDFDNDDQCGWTQDISDAGDWQVKITNPQDNTSITNFDHTFGKGFNGKYMYVGGWSCPTMLNGSARLLSPVYSSLMIPNREVCFIFWYSMPSSSGATLRVYHQAVNEIRQSTFDWEQRGPPFTDWRQAIVKFPTLTATSFQVVLEVIRGDGPCDVAIDDVSLVPGENCTNSDFETSSDEDVSTMTTTTASVTTVSLPQLTNTTTVSTSTTSQTTTLSTLPRVTITRPILPSTTTPGSTLASTRSTLRPTLPPTTSPFRITLFPPPTTTPRPTLPPTTTTPRPTLPPTTSTPRSTPTTTSTPRPTPTTIQRTTPTTRLTTHRITRPLSTTLFTTRIRTKITTSFTTRITAYTTSRTPRITQQFLTTNSKSTSGVKTRPITSTTPEFTLSGKGSESLTATSEEPGLLMMAVGAVGGAVLLVLTAAAVLLLVRRRRARRRNTQGLTAADDSEVRFLTASDGDIQLDFTLAAPSSPS